MHYTLGCTPTNLLANGTTLVRTGIGVMAGVNINVLGASSNTLKLYDGLTAAGTLIGTIDTTVALGPTMPNVKFSTGLTAVLGTGTAADITILVRD